MPNTELTKTAGGPQTEVTLPVKIRRPAAAAPSEEQSPNARRVPRIARLMALAITFQDLVDRGDVRDYADLARLGYVSRARLTQIMNLLLLAPDIQEGVLFGMGGHERSLRTVCAAAYWPDQRLRLAGAPELSLSRIM